MSSLLVKSKSSPGEHGFRPEERPFPLFLRYSVAILDKPSGPSSHVVTKRIKDALNMGLRVGHCGTLDPKVTGVLPIVIGEATKATPLITTMDKEYVGTMYLHGDVTDEELAEVLKMFETVIYQRPPVRSAVSRTLRTRKIYKIEVLSRRGRYVELRTVVESGTYIRKLYHDIGEVLGVGASMIKLRRVRVGHITEDMCVDLETLLRAVELYRNMGDEHYLREKLIPVEEAVKHVKRIVVKDSAVSAIAHGAPVLAPGVSLLSEGISKGDLVGIFTLKGELVAIARALMSSEEILRAEKGVVAELLRVVMERDLYPRMWRRRPS